MDCLPTSISLMLRWKVLLWLCWIKVQWLFIWEALVSLYFTFERQKRWGLRSQVKDPKHCPPKQPLLLSPWWQPKFFSFPLPLLSGGMWESLGQNVASSLVLQMIKEANQVWLSVMLLFRVAAVSCVSQLWQGLHIFFSIWHLNVSDMLGDLIGMTALKNTGGSD